ncbi:hypothetical protein ACVWW6_005877 [Bradyrhizobium sp. USDA 3311]
MKIGIIGVQLEQLLLIGGQAEEVALLLDPFDRRALRPEAHAVVVQARLVFGVVGFVAHRVPARIGVGIDVAVRFHAPPDLLGGAVVLLFGGADETVERHVEPLVHRLEAGRVTGRERGRGQALVLRGLNHLQAVLVGAGQEEHVLAVEPCKACQRVGGDRLIGVADMRVAVGIGDRGRDVEDVVARGGRCGHGGLRSCDGIRRAGRLGFRHIGLHSLRRRGDRRRCGGHGSRSHLCLLRRSLLCRRLGRLFGRFLRRLLGADLLLRSLLAGLLCRLRSALLHALLGGSLLGLIDLLGSFARERLHGLFGGLLRSFLAALALDGFFSSRCHDEFLYRLLEIWRRTCVRLLF